MKLMRGAQSFTSSELMILKKPRNSALSRFYKPEILHAIFHGNLVKKASFVIDRFPVSQIGDD
jgi:hypothetical protein